MTESFENVLKRVRTNNLSHSEELAVVQKQIGRIGANELFDQVVHDMVEKLCAAGGVRGLLDRDDDVAARQLMGVMSPLHDAGWMIDDTDAFAGWVSEHSLECDEYEMDIRRLNIPAVLDDLPTLFAENGGEPIPGLVVIDPAPIDDDEAP